MDTAPDLRPFRPVPAARILGASTSPEEGSIHP
jgi:hypothetical protein